MRFNFQQKIVLRLLMVFSFMVLTAANEHAVSQDTLSPVSAIDEETFQKSFISYRSLREKLQQIKSVYEEEMQYVYPEGDRTTYDEYGNRIGLLWFSDMDDINFILDNIPMDEQTLACDLGSGIGNVCGLFAVRGARVTGYEIDGYLRNVSENILQYGLNGIIDPSKVRFEKADFMQEDLSQYDVIFYYGHGFLGEREPEFKAKLIRELKPGALLIIYLGGEILRISELPEVEHLPGYRKLKHLARIYTKYGSFASLKEAVLDNRLINQVTAVSDETRVNIPKAEERLGISRMSVEKSI